MTEGTYIFSWSSTGYESFGKEREGGKEEDEEKNEEVHREGGVMLFFGSIAWGGYYLKYPVTAGCPIKHSPSA